MRKLLLISSFICVTSIAHSKGPASTSGTTLLKSISARAAGISEACASLSGNAMTINYNPAGLADLGDPELCLTYQTGLTDDSLAAVIFGKDFSFASLGAAVIYYTTGKIDLYDSEGSLISKTGQKDIIAIVSSAEKFKELSAGLSLKFISSEIFGNNAVAIAGDLGLQYRMPLNINMGISIQNIGNRLTYLEKPEKLPALVRPGISWKYKTGNNTFIVATDFPYYIYDKAAVLSAGAEAAFENNLSIRIGHKASLNKSSYFIEDILSIGWGLNIKSIQFNHSVVISNSLNYPQSFSIVTKF